MLNLKLDPILLIFTIGLGTLGLFQNNLCSCNSEEFQSNVDVFIDAFDDAFPTEISSSTIVQNQNLGNEVLQEESIQELEINKEAEDAVEEVAVTETVHEPGSDIRHDVSSPDVRALADRVLMSISPSLKLINITEAVSMVTDKVQRSLWLQVSTTDCRDEGCVVSCRVDITSSPGREDVVWHNCQDNEVLRAKRWAVGGFKKVDDEESKELAEIACQTLDSIDADDIKRKVTQVIRAQKQLVNGIMYHLTLEVASTTCKEDAETCEGELMDYNICKILMQRLFSGEEPHNAQVIKSECTPISKAKDAENRKRTKRHVTVYSSESNMILDHEHPLIPKHHKRIGGKTYQDPQSGRIQELSAFALSELDKASNSVNKQKIVRVIDARSQVVAGVKYFLKLELVETNCRKGEAAECKSVNEQKKQTCEVVLWEKPWEKFRSISKINCQPVHERAERGLPGGYSPADKDSPEVKEIAQFAVSQLDASSNSLNQQKLIEIEDAQTQVVAGKNYKLTLQLTETNCRKGSEITSSCSYQFNKPGQKCEVVVYDRPWDKHREMTKAKCSPFTTARRRRDSHNENRMVLGGHTPQDKNSKDIQDVAQFAVADINHKSNAAYKQTLVEIISAHTQVVSGIAYHLKLKIAESSCKNNADNAANCVPKENAEQQECDISIWSQPWLKKQQITKSECRPFATKQGLPGGYSPADKDSPEVKEIAQFAVSQLDASSNSLNQQKLVFVEDAQTQVVAGKNYKLILQLAATNCRKGSEMTAACSSQNDKVVQKCEVIVYDRPWDKHREMISAKCSPFTAVRRKRASRGTPGKPKPIDPLAPDVLEAATFALKMIDKTSNSMYKHALIRVVDANVQTVSGRKYFLTVEVGESECTKNVDQENCNLRQENSLIDKCEVVVWDRPWLKKKEVLQVKCGLRNKRSIVKGPDNEHELHLVHASMFNEFKKKYNRAYTDEAEHNRRFRIFRANLKKIQTFQDNEQGTAIYGPNMFADLTASEFKRHLGLKAGPGPKPSSHHLVPAQIPDVPLPVDFDWRDHNVVTPVKNQGMCGSCWAFSVTGNVEGQWALKHGKLLSLSEQELVDCDKVDNGCNGGYMTSAYEAIEKLGGLETESDYPYDAADESCKFNKSEIQATVSSSVNITSNETQMAQWLFKNGPISIGINANAMQFYMGGVSHPFKFLCSKTNLDHGVLLVGFGVHRTSIRHKLLPYWLVKNSWGPHWGEKGYYRVYRGDGTCGVNQMASSSIVD